MTGAGGDGRDGGEGASFGASFTAALTAPAAAFGAAAALSTDLAGFGTSSRGAGTAGLGGGLGAAPSQTSLGSAADLSACKYGQHCQTASLHAHIQEVRCCSPS